jgi:hypothetical protein
MLFLNASNKLLFSIKIFGFSHSKGIDIKPYKKTNRKEFILICSKKNKKWKPKYIIIVAINSMWYLGKMARTEFNTLLFELATESYMKRNIVASIKVTIMTIIKENK